MTTDFSATNLPFLANDCMMLYGNDDGKRIYQKALELYNRFAERADYRNNPAIRYHMTAKLFPAISFYKALLWAEISQNALEDVRTEMRKAAEADKADNEKFSRLPFAYRLYRSGVKRHMKKNFPADGRETEWIKCDGKEIIFHLHSCLYHETCLQNGCPESRRLYCENDVTAFSGLLPKIGFERKNTIGAGSAHCDFRFINMKAKL